MTTIQRVPYMQHERLIAGRPIPDESRKSTYCYGDFSFRPAPGMIAGEQGFLTFWRESDGYYIGGICVEPEYRGKGVAEAMLKELVAIARAADVSEIQAHVDEDNGASQRFFEKHGFQQCLQYHTIEYMLALKHVSVTNAR